ncbi:MAG: limonene-1,2-epoxide hydrolase family protein [Novosphingobium sp.]
MPDNLQKTLDFIALWSRMDIEEILAALAPDCIYHNMPWPPLTGHDAIRDGLATFLGSAREIDWRVLHAAQSSDGTVLTERLDRFLIGKTWLEMPVMGIFEWRDGRIAHWRDYFDSAQFEAAMAALG